MDGVMEGMREREHIITNEQDLRFLHDALRRYVGEEFSLTSHVEQSIERGHTGLRLTSFDAFLARAVLHEEGRLEEDTVAI